jgi:multidrug resistance efflux pump
MLELVLCSMVTILPDYLFRRYAQGKRFGHKITLYSVWFELRWGIIACLILTVLLITMIFYYHPSTKNAVSFFRTVPLLPETSDRVEEIYVNTRDKVKAGQPIFKLDSSKQEAALETARRRIAEVDAAMEQAQVELEAADGKIQEAQGAYQLGAYCRLRPDRGASHEARHDCRGNLHRQARHHHSDGDHGGPGLYRGRTGQADGRADRCAAGGQAWYADHLP